MESVLRVIAVLTAVLILAACKDAEPVVLATGGNYYPFNIINDEGELEGLEIEMANELCRRAELECTWVINEWENMIPDLVAQEFDAILSGMSITAKREQWIDFTEAYYPPTPSVYLARKGAGDQALSGVLGASENTIYSDYFEETGRDYVPLGEFDDVADAVLGGEIDAVLVDHGYAINKLAERGDMLEIVGPPVPLDRGPGIGVRKGSPLKARFDRALSSMKEDGSLNALLRKFVGADAKTFE